MTLKRCLNLGNRLRNQREGINFAIITQLLYNLSHAKFNSRNRIMRSFSFVYTIIIVLSVSYFQLFAIEFKPMNAEFSPTKGTTRSFTAINTSKNELAAVQMSIADWHVDIDGIETYTNNEEDFLIYPSQMILKPEQTQVVRVTWLGNKSQETELAYRIIAEQLPVDLNAEAFEGSGRIKVMMKFIGGLYITNPSAKPNIILKSTIEENYDTIRLIFENNGMRHDHLHDLSIAFTSKDTDIKVTLHKEQLDGINGENILAKTSRRFKIPWPEKLPKGPVSITFTYDLKR